MLSRDAILKAIEIPHEDIEIRELGGSVRVRGMTGVERDAFEASCIQGRGRKRDFNMRNIRAKLVASCCVDDSGARLFSDGDIDQLGQIRADVLDKLFAVAQRLSGMREEDLEELGQPSANQTIIATSSSASRSSSE